MILLFKRNLRKKQDHNFLIILVHTAFPMLSVALSANTHSHLFVIRTKLFQLL